MADSSLLSRRRMLKLGVTGAAGAALVGAPVKDAPLVVSPSGPGRISLALPTFAMANAQDINGVPSYILPPITVTAPAGFDDSGNLGSGWIGGNYGQQYFQIIQQLVWQKRAYDAQVRQRQAIADQWNDLYADWSQQFGPDSARIATQLQWAGMEAAWVVGVIATLEAAAGAIEAGGYVFNQTSRINAFLAEGMRNAGILAQIAGFGVGFAVYFSGAAAIAAGFALIYLAAMKMSQADGYVGLRPIGAPQDQTGDTLFFVP